jgi:hypothetical protein
MKVLVSGSGQSLPLVPWIAVLNPDVTSTAQRGNYVVYLYNVSLTRIYLSANQGSTQHRLNAVTRGLRNRAAELSALEELRAETSALTSGVGTTLLDMLAKNIDLGAPNNMFLPQGYEAGNVGAIEYDVTDLPDNITLTAHLRRMIHLNETIVSVKEEILAKHPGKITTAATTTKPSQTHPQMFIPKDSSQYRTEVKSHTQTKSRRHEALLTNFYKWLKENNLVAANNVHPRDLTVDGPGLHWLVEAKTVPANAEIAVREAIGQLFSYRHFFYRQLTQPDPHLVALFTEPIGNAFALLLDSLGIESIWWNGTEWDGQAPNTATSLRRAAQSQLTSSP